jgi:hypothetical protein
MIAKNVDIIVIIISGVNHVGNVLLNHSVNTLPTVFPAKALTVVIANLPKKNAVENFTILYFIEDSEIITGSSGSGVAAVKQSHKKACLCIFVALASSVASLFSLKRLLMSGMAL